MHARYQRIIQQFIDDKEEVNKFIDRSTLPDAAKDSYKKQVHGSVVHWDTLSANSFEGKEPRHTELGMISWQQAIEGVTHGLPGLSRSDFEMVPQDDEWVGARLPQEMMFELLRTPTFTTIQGECWQFCCQQPMIFLGEWTREEFSRRAPDGNGERLFAEIVQHPVPGLWEDELHDETGVYVFRCPPCSRQTANWDLA